MLEELDQTQAPLRVPPIWIRLSIFLCLSWGTGFLALIMSPGGQAQTFSTQIESILIFPLYTPFLAAFSVGGMLHSAIVFFAALIICYIGSIFLVGVLLGTKSGKKFYGAFVALVIELLLALLGQTIFVHNMQSWT